MDNKRFFSIIIETNKGNKSALPQISRFRARLLSLVPDSKSNYEGDEDDDDDDVFTPNKPWLKVQTRFMHMVNIARGTTDRLLGPQLELSHDC